MSTIAFFGPTGGCVNACLAHTLLNGNKVIALARTPSKLTTQLLEQPGLTTEILDTQLKIIQGDGMDIEAVMKTIIVSETGSEKSTQPTLVNMIISGMGGTGTMAFTRPSPCDKIPMRVPTLPHVVIPNPHVTEQFTMTFLEALGQIAERFDSFADYAAVAPRVMVISGTGIKEGLNDVPYLFKKMYDVLLPIPHEDKKQMERLLETERKQRQSLLVGGLIIVRPSFMEGDHKIAAPGVDDRYEKLKVGTEKKPAVGYMIPRAWVGRWMFEEVVKTGGGKWVGEGAILTA
ncbi:hypothetical protein N7494_002001 [Penicillium frequentans]|uniref:NAD(P)-binding domain-containing protein n=1 Tax=Penicillium frequentans TaxID=3151616 RepID=A0AAD6D4U5_9EURO|nr:hypothetical protein N7494_002001 [Penicillium glabrum]